MLSLLHRSSTSVLADGLGSRCWRKRSRSFLVIFRPSHPHRSQFLVRVQISSMTLDNAHFPVIACYACNSIRCLCHPLCVFYDQTCLCFDMFLFRSRLRPPSALWTLRLQHPSRGYLTDSVSVSGATGKVLPPLAPVNHWAELYQPSKILGNVDRHTLFNPATISDVVQSYGLDDGGEPKTVIEIYPGSSTRLNPKQRADS